jgi:hypothetical protein
VRKSERKVVHNVTYDSKYIDCSFVADLGMLGSRGPKGFAQESSAEISPLESLLQRAWLQSHKPKVQRRISSAPVTDVSVGRRAGSQPSSPAFSGIISSQTDDGEEPNNFFFHKSKLDASTVLISRFALPIRVKVSHASLGIHLASQNPNIAALVQSTLKD